MLATPSARPTSSPGRHRRRPASRCSPNRRWGRRRIQQCIETRRKRSFSFSINSSARPPTRGDDVAALPDGSRFGLAGAPGAGGWSLKTPSTGIDGAGGPALRLQRVETRRPPLRRRYADVDLVVDSDAETRPPFVHVDSGAHTSISPNGLTRSFPTTRFTPFIARRGYINAR